MLSKKYIRFIIIPAIAVVAFAACKKSELTAFNQKAMVHFYKRFDDSRRDSNVYSFAIMPAGRMQDTIKLPVRISGVASDKDRTIKLQPVQDSTNAVAGKDYEVYSAIVHADRYSDSIVLIVKRAPEMKTTEKRLLLEIVASDDFQPGLFNTPSADAVLKSSGGSVRILVKINDFLTKPSNWDQMLTSFFGNYSNVKYKFIIDVTGRGEFPLGTSTGLPYGQMQAYQQLMRQALIDYNREHGDMIDENGGIVTF